MAYSAANNKEDKDSIFQLTMDLEMKAHKLGYEEEAYDHIMESDTESETEAETEDDTELETGSRYDSDDDDSIELLEEESEVDETLEDEESSILIKSSIQSQLDRVMKEQESDELLSAEPEFAGDVSAVRFDVGRSTFMQPDVFAQNQAFFLSMLSNRFASLIKRDEVKEWKETIRYHYLTDEEIMESLSGDSAIQRAFRSDALTRFVVITMEEDCYYRAGGMTRLKECLEKAGVSSTRLYKASDSDQWQLFIFFEKSVRADLVTRSLSAWLRRNGIVPGTAGLDMFPGKGSLTIPLQPGFEFLNETGQVIATRNQITLEAALALFLNDMVRCSVKGMELIEKVEELTREEA